MVGHPTSRIEALQEFPASLWSAIWVSLRHKDVDKQPYDGVMRVRSCHIAAWSQAGKFERLDRSSAGASENSLITLS